MALPRIDTPTYQLTLPSTQEKIDYRPFLVKEQKIIMMAQESDSDQQMVTAMQKLVTSCTFNKLDIMNLPVKDIADDNCILLMWAIDPMLDKALQVINAWGFQYKTVGFTWAKTNRTNLGFFTGLGYWTRANPEMCLLATKGRPKRKAKDVAQLVVEPRQEHTKKP